MKEQKLEMPLMLWVQGPTCERAVNYLAVTCGDALFGLWELRKSRFVAYLGPGTFSLPLRYEPGSLLFDHAVTDAGWYKNGWLVVDDMPFDPQRRYDGFAGYKNDDLVCVWNAYIFGLPLTVTCNAMRLTEYGIKNGCLPRKITRRRFLVFRKWLNYEE